VTFTRCFLWIFLGAPFVETLRGNKPLAGALSAITAAVVGGVLNLAPWFATHTIFAQVRPVAWDPFAFDAPVMSSVNLWALLLSVAAIVAIRFQIGIPTISACSAAGIALYLAGAIS
jgi:chromate transporter